MLGWNVGIHYISAHQEVHLLLMVSVCILYQLNKMHRLINRSTGNILIVSWIELTPLYWIHWKTPILLSTIAKEWLVGFSPKKNMLKSPRTHRLSSKSSRVVSSRILEPIFRRRHTSEGRILDTRGTTRNKTRQRIRHKAILNVPEGQNKVWKHTPALEVPLKIETKILHAI